jgi:hypothetical protein
MCAWSSSCPLSLPPPPPWCAPLPGPTLVSHVASTYYLTSQSTLSYKMIFFNPSRDWNSHGPQVKTEVSPLYPGRPLCLQFFKLIITPPLFNISNTTQCHICYHILYVIQLLVYYMFLLYEWSLCSREINTLLYLLYFIPPYLLGNPPLAWCVPVHLGPRLLIN